MDKLTNPRFLKRLIRHFPLCWEIVRPRLFSPLFWVFVCLPFMGGCSWLFEPEKIEKKEDLIFDLPKIPYKTLIIPEHPDESTPDVEDHLKAVSLLLRLESSPPSSLNALYHRTRSDVKRLKQALAEKGYFDGQVKVAIDQDAKPVMVTLTFKPGKRYTLSKITVMAAKDSFEPLKLSPSKARKTIQLKIGEDVDLNHVQEANQRLAKYLRDHGYPQAEMDEPEGEIDRENKQLHLIFRALPGRYASFGKTEVSGLKNLNPRFVRNRLVWQEGEQFDEREVETTRVKLMGTGLFSSVEIHPDEHFSETSSSVKEIPMSVHLTEGPPRTIGAGLKYATTEGIGSQVFWSHRNIFGSGEGLNLSLKISKLLTKAKIDLDIPDIFSPEQHLRTELSATREQNRAFISRSVEAGVRLEHPFTDTIKGMMGLLGEAGHVKRANVTYLNRLIGLPVEMQIDTSNDLINPTKGGRLSAQITPYIGRSGKDRRLTTSTAKGSYYLRLLKGDTLVLAGWVHGGTIFASSLDNIAPNKRFYAGGAGSVRAYGYKLLGPLDSNRVPLGGRSILEYGLEGRFKITDTLGFVIFGEAGSLSTKASPDLSSQARLWGLGMGVRYYTSIGPIRFDIATPLKRRRPLTGKPIDAPYQFYVSVGQAF